MMPAALIAISAVAALALIGYGCWMVYPPAGLISVGGLIWVELVIWGISQSRTPADKQDCEGSGDK